MTASSNVANLQDQSPGTETWLIERLVPGGDGFLRLPDGRAAFATGALPGDRIVPRDVEQRRGYLRARRWDLAEPGSHRVEPECPIADDCGGCDWMRLDRKAELVAKASLLREALERTGGFRALPEPLAIVTAGSELGYRSRVRLHVDEAGRVGFFARESHRLVVVNSCIVCRPELEEALGVLGELSRQRAGAFSAFDGIELRTAPAGPRVAARFSLRDPAGALPEATRELILAIGARMDVSIAGRAEPAHDEQRYPLPKSVELAVPPGVFSQVNWDVNLALVGAVVEGARSRGVKSFLDLYAGAGNFALPLLASGLDGMAVDGRGAGIEAARRSALRHGYDAGGFVTGEVQRVVEKLVASGRGFDLVVLDPPREGARRVLEAAIRLEAPHLAIASCDPVTLARDLRILAGAGYVLDEVRGYDMFPRTHHLEALAWMRRVGRLRLAESPDRAVRPA